MPVFAFSFCNFGLWPQHGPIDLYRHVGQVVLLVNLTSCTKFALSAMQSIRVYTVRSDCMLCFRWAVGVGIVKTVAQPLVFPVPHMATHVKLSQILLLHTGVTLFQLHS